MSDISRIVDKMYTKIILEKPVPLKSEDAWALYAAHAVRSMEIAGKDSGYAWNEVVGTLEQTQSEYLNDVAFQLLGIASAQGEIAPYANAAVDVMVAKGVAQADAERYVGGMIGVAKPGQRAEMARGLFLLAAKMNGEADVIMRSCKEDGFTNYVRVQPNTVRLANMTPEMLVAIEGSGIDGHVEPYEASPIDSHEYEHWHSA